MFDRTKQQGPSPQEDNKERLEALNVGERRLKFMQVGDDQTMRLALQVGGDVAKTAAMRQRRRRCGKVRDEGKGENDR